LLVLRHENAVPQRHAGRVRYEPCACRKLIHAGERRGALSVPRPHPSK
jgi:hypothetical protein